MDNPFLASIKVSKSDSLKQNVAFDSKNPFLMSLNQQTGNDKSSSNSYPIASIESAPISTFCSTTNAIDGAELKKVDMFASFSNNTGDSFGNIATNSVNLFETAKPFGTTNQITITSTTLTNPFSSDVNRPAKLFSQDVPSNKAIENPFFKKDVSITKQIEQPKSSTIQLENIPQKFYAREFLSEFYSKYGVIINIEVLNDLHNTATIKYVNIESAKNALESGTVLEDGDTPISIKYMNESITRNPFGIKPNNESSSIKDRLAGSSIKNRLALSVAGSHFKEPSKLDVPKSSAVVPKFPTKLTTTFPRAVKPKQRHHSFDDFQDSLDRLAEKLSKTHCPDPKSKYDLLELFDKEIRQSLSRDRRNYKALRGICIDMCPEKERYQREDRNQASYYELNDQQDCLLYTRAVKEYSRSSADQEEPLPHELRPASSLTFTMDYMIHNLMTLDLTKRPDWFDFVWNRTRAIRKDITQQNLCCETSIDLVEKCVRFHIFCAHHLCEHDLHVFDQKINLENLTKCLQTLKHMYEDIREQKGYHSPNENEFRSYQILLNMNDGDMLREVMEFKDDTRKSKFVKFALQVLSAVRENNYIRFFKLLKLSSFLSGCLMHSYFNQIRANALRLMARSFSVPKSDLEYPLSDLQRILAFNDMQDTEEFCTHYGFGINDEYILFNSTSYMNPDESYPRKKCEIIQDKCILTLSEVINGKDMQLLEDYHPTNSFSPNGYYVGNYHELEKDEFEDSFKDVSEQEELIYPSINSTTEESTIEIFDDNADEEEERYREEDEEIYAQDEAKQNSKDNVDFYVDESIVVSSEDDENGVDGEPQIMILREDINVFSAWFIQNQIEEVTKETLCQMFDELQLNLSQLEAVVNQFLAIECINESRNIAVNVIIQEEKKNQRELTEIKQNVETSISESVIASTVETLLTTLSAEVINEKGKEIENETTMDVSKLYTNQLIDEHVKSSVNQISVGTLNTFAMERKQKLVQCQNDFKKIQLRKLLNRWTKAFKYRVNVKHILNEFPATPSFNTAADTLKYLKPGVHKRKSYGLHDAYDMLRGGESKTQRSIQEYLENMKKIKDRLHQKIQLDSVIQHVLSSNNQDSELNNGYINIVLQCHNNNISFNNLMNANIIKEKIRNNEESDQSSLYRSNVCFNTKKDLKRILTTTFTITELSQARLDQFEVSGFLFLTNEVELKRIGKEIDQLQHRHPDIPIALLIITDHHCEEFYKELHTSAHIWISEVSTDMKEVEECEETIVECFEWLVKRSRCFPSVKSTNLSSFVEECLDVVFFKKFQAHCLSCQQLQLPPPDANDVITFYNNTLDEIKRQLDETLLLLEQYGHIFNDHSTVNEMKDCITKLRLPTLASDYDKNNWESCNETCMEYIHTLHHDVSPQFISKMNSRLKYHWMLADANRTLPVFPWPEIVELCVFNALTVLHRDGISEYKINYRPSTIQSMGDVSNPLKGYMREQSIYKSLLDDSVDYRQSIKRRKYCREHRLRDVVDEVNTQLETIEESMRQRRRKSARLSLDKENEPMKDLLNQSRDLFYEIEVEKFNITLSKPVEMFVDKEETKQHDEIVLHAKMKLDKSTKVSLETSVIRCVDDISESKYNMVRSNEYWKNVLLDR